MPDILVLYYSRHGAVRNLAERIACGIEAVPGASARLRTVPRVTACCEALEDSIPADGPPYVEHRDLEECIGLALGSPVRFGNMAAPMKYFWDSTTLAWHNGALVDKPACVFTSSGSLHGGNETTLLSMMLPLMHHGMVLMGVPFTEPSLRETREGGTPYGVSHIAGSSNHPTLSESERLLAFQQGQRLAKLALKMSRP